MTTELNTTGNMQRSPLAVSGAQDKTMPLVIPLVERHPPNEEAATPRHEKRGSQSSITTRRKRRTAPNTTRHASFGIMNSSSLLSLIIVGLLTILSNPRSMAHAQESETKSSSSSRQVLDYDLPTFSMLMHVLVETTNADDDDTTIYDDPVYLDLEIFQETLDRVTQFHLIDMFQRYEGFHEEQFLKVQLVTKVRQQDSLTDISSSSSTNNSNEKHVPLQSAFSGVISYSFPTEVVPEEADVDQTIAGILERALVGDNFLLLLQRYLSTGVLGAIEDIVEIQIGTKPILQLGFGGVEPVEQQPPLTSSTDDDKILFTNPQGTTSQNANAGQSNNNNQQLNAITIVAIVTFLTLSCFLMLFGATVILVMKDRAKQEEALQGDTMTSLGMGSNGKGKNGEDTDMDEEVGGRTKTNRHGDSKNMPAWKRAVLPVLRRAILVRRYWKKQIRKQRKTSRAGASTPTSNDSPTQPAHDESSNNNDDDAYGDDGLNDEDIYYDDDLTDEEAANQWLDNWTQSLTSIPVRNVSRATSAEAVANSPNMKRTKKKKKQPLAPHPARRQSEQNFLGEIIEEEEDEVESDDDYDEKKEDDSAVIYDSVVVEDGLGDRHQELKSVIMDEDYTVGSPSLSAVSPSTKSYGSSARKKKHVEQDDLPAPLSLDLGDVDDLDHDDRIEDVDLS